MNDSVPGPIPAADAFDLVEQRFVPEGHAAEIGPALPPAREMTASMAARVKRR